MLAENRSFGIDIDGTITRFPVFFSQFTSACVAQGILVHIVTSRSNEGRLETVKELNQLGIRYNWLHMLAPISEAQVLCPHTDLDWYAKHCWLKVDYALRNSITHFIDDDLRVLNMFSRFSTTIIVSEPVDFVKKRGYLYND